MAQLDLAAQDDEYPYQRKGDWLWPDLTRKKPAEILHVGTLVRVLLARDDQEQLWVGEIVERNDEGALLKLWGSGCLLADPFASQLRAGVVPRHSHAEFVAVAQCQRRGQPARVRDLRPEIEVSDDVMAKVVAYAAQRGVTPDQAADHLIGLAIRRLAALRRYASAHGAHRRVPSSSTCS
jgi:hypothetical protein